MRRRQNLGGIVSAFALLSITVSAMVIASAHMPITAYAAQISGMLVAPTIAIKAQQKLLEQNNTKPPEALPAAQTFDEDDYSSGFWAVPPTEAETAPLPIVTPPNGALPIVQAHYEQGEGKVYIPCGTVTIKNCTALSREEISAEIGKPLSFSIERNSTQPQILIMHTHTTETFQLTDEEWYSPDFQARSTDENVNMVAVGEVMKTEFELAGINTLHDTKLHDYPSYNGAYARSNATVREYLAQYPSIKIVLDVHRDAIQKDDGTRIKPVAEIDGEKCAQVMLICGADKKGNLPNFKQNLRFASLWQAEMGEDYEGLARPLLFDYRYYNQDLTFGSILIEVGGHANTLDEAKAAGKYSARALAKALL